MNNLSFERYAGFYRSQLLNNIIPFWEVNSPDKEYGGYFTCLDRRGKVFDTDKFVWLQCRQVWTFAMLYNNIEKKQDWLDFALHGATFLMKHGRDKNGDWYFSLNREGKPLIQPYNIFSDCFAAMAFSQLYAATGDPKHIYIAKETFFKILRKQDNPKGKYSKAFPGTRRLKDFALPMILSNLVLEIEHIIEPDIFNKIIHHGIDEVMNNFYRPELEMIVENLQIDNTLSDSFEGRVINPGHGLEAMWFMMDLAERNSDKDLMDKSVEITLKILDYGWDEEFGGIFYFRDRKETPPLQLEWDQKLWWVHLEALIAVAKGYLHTGNKRCWEWLEKLHEYSWSHFADKENGEWFGYLNRKGEAFITLKGGKWKGCFHVPRAFYQLWKVLGAIDRKSNQITKP